MKTRILIACLASMGVFVSLSCEDNRICDEHADCLSMCKTYENNDLLSVCTAEGTCLCLSQEDISCTEAAACTPVCEKYRPGTTPSCVNESCKCLGTADKDEK